MNFDEYNTKYKNYQKMINNEFEKFLLSINFLDETFIEILKYLILNEGKKIRPILCLNVFEIFSNSDDYPLKLALSIELIHNFSLVHDDLPSMDNDDYRRGKLTIHKKFGEANAILIGDYLLNAGYELLIEFMSENPQYLKKSNTILSLFSKSIGSNGLIVGQYLDINCKKIDLEKINNIYSLKTGALIETSVMSAAILSEINSIEYKTMQKISKNLGELFQLVDDINDWKMDSDLNILNHISKDECKNIIEIKYNQLTSELIKISNRDINFIKCFAYNMVKDIV